VTADIIKAENVSLATVSHGDVDIQVQTAKAYPRSLKAFADEVRTIIQINKDLADGCSYALRRGRNIITGPSIRFAEIIAGSWGNLREEKRSLPPGPGDKTIVGQATAWDLERNRALRVESVRRITDKEGRRYSDDMVAMTGNAAASIAHRNAVLAVIPKGLWAPLYEHACEMAAGGIATLDETRDKAFAYWSGKGVSAERILAALGRPSIEDINIGDIATLKAIFASHKDGELSLEDAFPPLEKPRPKPGRGKINEMKAETKDEPVEIKKAENEEDKQSSIPFVPTPKKNPVQA
jgi:hypothetical protein